MSGSQDAAFDRIKLREAAGVFHSLEALEAAVDDLLRAGFDRSDIDLMADRSKRGLRSAASGSGCGHARGSKKTGRCRFSARMAPRPSMSTTSRSSAASRICRSTSCWPKSRPERQLRLAQVFGSAALPR
jgi:hypothetical protein